MFPYLSAVYTSTYAVAPATTLVTVGPSLPLDGPFVSVTAILNCAADPAVVTTGAGLAADVTAVVVPAGVASVGSDAVALKTTAAFSTVLTLKWAEALPVLGDVVLVSTTMLCRPLLTKVPE